MAKQVTATLTIGFGAASADQGADALIAEVDSRDDGLNKGKSTFLPGEDVYILLYQGSGVTLQSVVASSGQILAQPSLSPQIVELEEDVIFANESQANVSKPIYQLASTKWLGNSLGNIVKSGESLLSLATPPGAVYAGVNRINYKSQAKVYKLTNTLIANLTDYSIVVVFIGTAA